MIRFLSVSLRNFLSYGNVVTTVNLDTSGPTFIMGQNLDVAEDASSNGCGKTTIINALVFALYGKPITKFDSVNDLINSTNKKNLIVQCEFRDDNDCVYVVERGRKVTKLGNYVNITKDGKDLTPAGNSNTDTMIEEIIGMPYEMFTRIVTFSATLDSFLDLPVRSASGANQTDIIEELFDLSILSKKANTLKVRIKDTKQDILLTERDLSDADNAYTRYCSQLESAKERMDGWLETHQSNLKKIKDYIEENSDTDFDLQQKIITKYESEIDKRKSLSQDKKSLTRDNSQLERELNQAEDELEELKTNICPYCKQEYLDNKAKQEEAQAVINTNKPLLAKNTKKLATIETKLTKIDKALAKLEDAMEYDSLNDLFDDKSSLDKYTIKLEEGETAENPHIDAYNELESNPIDEPDRSELDTLHSELEHQQFLLKLLTKKDSFIRKALLQRNIPFLNERLAWYVNAIGLPHIVKFNQEMMCDISKFDKIIKFKALSSGQKARVNIALSFAFRDVLQRAHGVVNVCMLDEVLDVGLDSVGIKQTALMLKKKAYLEKLSLFIISHRSEIANEFKNVLTVKMKDDFSFID